MYITCKAAARPRAAGGMGKDVDKCVLSGILRLSMAVLRVVGQGFVLMILLAYVRQVRVCIAVL